jgi:formylglycine-generating enzyme required for sulfatase activity
MSKLRQRVYYGVVALVLFFVLSLTTCELFGDLDNPADPNSSNYQGYNVVDSVEDVKPIQPESDLSFPPTLYSSKLIGASEYRFQIAPDLSFSNIEIDVTQETNIFIPSTWTPIEGKSTYYFRVCAKKNEQWGEWSTGQQFKIGVVGNTTTTSTTIASTKTVPKMVEVASGTFNNGSSNVTLSKFYISTTEITQEMYEDLIGFNPSAFKESNLRPVEKVSFYDALEYCNALSVHQGLSKVYTITNRTPSTGYPIMSATVTADFTKDGYRLPTEAEWEFAARGGTKSNGYVYAGSNTLDSVGWYLNNANSTTHDVATKLPNELGLYDMSGNVWEWCWDWYSSTYPSIAQLDPLGPTSGNERTLRGGCWSHVISDSTVTRRGFWIPSGVYDDLGFRVVSRTAPASQTVKSGLVGEWLFNGSTQDTSGNGNAGVVSGAVLGSDRSNNLNSAYYFDGVDDKIDFPLAFNVGIENFTISLWFNFTDFLKSKITLFNTNPHNYLSIGYWDNTSAQKKLLFFLSTTGTSWQTSYIASSKNDYSASKWYFLTFIKKGNIYSMRIDNQQILSYTASNIFNSFSSTPTFRIGAISLLPPTDQESFHGYLDDLRIYNRQLSDEEIYYLFTN